MPARHLRLGLTLLAALDLLAPPAITAAAGSLTVQETHEPWPLQEGPAADVRSVAVGPQGRVWAATAAGVFHRFPGDGSGRWHPVPIEAEGPAFAVVATAAGAFAGTWAGVWRMTPDSARRVGSLAVPVTAVAADGHATLVAAGPHGVWRWQDGRWRRLPDGPSLAVQAAALAPDGSLWLATKMGLWREGDGHRGYVRGPLDNVSADVRGVAFAADGRVVGAALGGVQFYRRQRLERQLTPVHGLPSSDVQAVALAPDGTWWFGTRLGIARWDGRRWSLRHGRRWLLDDDVRSLAFDPAGNAYAATAAGVSVIRRWRLTLGQKAEHYHEVLESRHVRPPGIVGPCRLRVPGDLMTWSPMDDDNDGGYTALYLAMESYRYAATKNPEAKAAADRAMETLEFLRTVTGTNGFLARTVVPADWNDTVHDPNRTWTDPEWAEELARDPRHKRVEQRWRPSADGRWRWKGDTSSDELTAHFFGYWAYFTHAADDAGRARVRRQVTALADHLIAHGYNLVDEDGRPTRWGVWSPARLNGDPDWAMERGINSLQILSFLKFAHHVTGDPKYAEHYHHLIAAHGYARNGLEAPNLNPAWRTHIDLELLAFAYPALLTLERDRALLDLYRRSLRRWHEAVRADQQPFFEVLHALLTGRTDGLPAALAALADQPLDLVQWTVDNTTREDLRIVRVPELEQRQTDRLVPPGERATLRTDRNPWVAVQGDGGRSESDGVFWLLPYWMARAGGLLAEGPGTSRRPAAGL